MATTKRPTSPGAEDLIGVVHHVLDHGEVELVDYMGTDEQLARVARVSTGSERHVERQGSYVLTLERFGQRPLTLAPPMMFRSHHAPRIEVPQLNLSAKNGMLHISKNQRYCSGSLM